ncbi:metalloprotease [Knoellia sinensis KCTC 19936]|uniref:Neutral metalloproteinase n=1 Tax=Knoellia sinensis KCTC 19936 TaxID=1385520 RepID=A0A0A0J226_9MICO|nr:protealysin inhibitor emfourin [Knoellia sinensis]KGN31153.1 metalloprotease [Knoellia sinensis KCTC 19936]
MTTPITPSTPTSEPQRPSSSTPVWCGIVPPYVLEALATSGDPHLEERARETLRLDQLRYERHGREHSLRDGGAVVSRRANRSTTEEPNRIVHDAENTTRLPGTRVRAEGDPATDDTAVNEAYDGLGATWDLWHTAYDRNSLDDRGLGLLATVHYGRNYDNAFWDGSQMVFGDGDGEVLLGFTRSLDVIGHELAHGVTQYTSGLVYQDQAGALNEHISDVFGILVKQRALGQTAEQSDWIIGAELLGPTVQGVGLRSMKEPGTAYDDPRLGQDPQPGHMRDFVVTDGDNGGVHINSGIPNRAFHLVATTLGGNAWERPGAIWYAVITGDIRADCDFATFAALTEAAAVTLHGEGSAEAEAVRAAWREVGVTEGAESAPGSPPVPGAPSPTPTPSPSPSPSPTPAPDPGRVTEPREVQLRRTGGFAGLVRERTVVLDQLPEIDALAWRSLLVGPEPRLQEFAGGPMQPDRFSYGVSCAAPPIDLTIPEPALPDTVRDLFDRTLGT